MVALLLLAHSKYSHIETAVALLFIALSKQCFIKTVVALLLIALSKDSYENLGRLAVINTRGHVTLGQDNFMVSDCVVLQLFTAHPAKWNSSRYHENADVVNLLLVTSGEAGVCDWASLRKC